MERDAGLDDGRVRRPRLGAHARLPRRASALNLKPGDALLLAGADVLADRLGPALLTAVEAGRRADADARRLGEPLGSFNPLVHAGRARRGLRAAEAAQRLRPQRAASGAMSEFRATTGRRSRPRLAGFDISARRAATRRPRRLAARRRRRARGSCSPSRRYRELWQVRPGDRALAGRVRDLGQGRRGSRSTGGENLRRSSRPGARRRRSSPSASRSTLAEAPDASAVDGRRRSTSTPTSPRCAPGRALIVARRRRRRRGARRGRGRRRRRSRSRAAGRLALEGDLAEAYERASVVVHGNVALATHGETVQQLLGSGRARARRSSASRSRTSRSRTSSRPTIRPAPTPRSRCA